MRLFPVTARRRLAVACTAGALVLGAASTPLAQADVKHLRHRQSQAQHSVKHARADLDESSKQATQAAAALSRSRAELRTGQAVPGSIFGVYVRAALSSSSSSTGRGSGSRPPRRTWLAARRPRPTSGRRWSIPSRRSTSRATPSWSG